MKTILALLLTVALAVPALAGGVVPGDKAPDFTLKDTEGNSHSLETYLKDGKIVVLEWFNPDCPFIIKHHKRNMTMNKTFDKVKDKGVVWLAINSGGPGKQGYGKERSRRAREEYKMPFPVLLDVSGEVGHSFGAKTTPHMFIITPDGVVAYAGAIDDNPSVDKMGKTNHVAAALNSLLKGEKVKVAETKPYGCSVKYY